ncbi:hypothetical protein IWZ01DRAFT_353296 [Phyllosticta capitalensis]
MPSSDPLSSSQPALGASRDRQSFHPVQDEATKDQKAPDDQKHQVHVQEVERSPPLQEPAPKRKLFGDIQASQSARRQRLEPGRSPSPGTEQDPLNQEKLDPVNHWVRYNSWPSNYTESAVPAEALTGVRRTSSKRDSKSASNKLNWDWDMGFSPPEQETASSSGTRRNLLNDSKTLDFVRNHPNTLDIFDKNSKARPEGLTESAKETCRKVLESKDTKCNETGPWMFYNDKWFERAFKRLNEMNESKVIQDAKPLVVPPVEPFYYGGDDSLEYLTESVDETWSLCIPILRGNVPKPDYAAGYFLDVAFTKEQQQVLKQFNTPTGDSPMRVTRRMAFPFLSCEAKSGAPDAPNLSEAEKQNVESTLIAMRGVTDLFQRADRASEIQLEILAFSVVYNDHEVRLFAHYADLYVDSSQPQFYRQKIYESLFRDVGLDAFRMIRYIYKVWAREHWERICSAIDTISNMPAYTSSTALSSSVTGTKTPASSSMPSASGSMPPPSEPRSRSSNERPQPQRSLTPDSSSVRDAKKPKTSG